MFLRRHLGKVLQFPAHRRQICRMRNAKQIQAWLATLERHQECLLAFAKVRETGNSQTPMEKSLGECRRRSSPFLQAHGSYLVVSLQSLFGDEKTLLWNIRTSRAVIAGKLLCPSWCSHLFDGHLCRNRGKERLAGPRQLAVSGRAAHRLNRTRFSTVSTSPAASTTA